MPSAAKNMPAAALAAGLLLLGCGSSSDSTADELEQGQTLTVASVANRVTTEIRAEGDHYKQGANAFLVDFDPPTTTLMDASAFMPVHGHSTAAPTIDPQDPGYRISNFVFTMPGLWNVTLDVKVGTKTDKVQFSLDVP